MKNIKLIIKDTHKYGKGVYAKKLIKKGETIHIFHGKRIDLNDVVKMIKSGKENLDDPFQIGRRTYLDLDEFSRTFNHSCDPNSGFKGNTKMFASRDINEGEQITYDYSLTIMPTDWEMKCKCGSKICRHKLGDVLSIPKNRLSEYKKAGVIQRYMKLLLREIESGKYKMPEYEKKALKILNS